MILGSNDKPVRDNRKGGKTKFAELVFPYFRELSSRFYYGGHPVAIVKEEVPPGKNGRCRITALTIETLPVDLRSGCGFETIEDPFVVVQVKEVIYEYGGTLFRDGLVILPPFPSVLIA